VTHDETRVKLSCFHSPRWARRERRVTEWELPWGHLTNESYPERSTRSATVKVSTSTVYARSRKTLTWPNSRNTCTVWPTACILRLVTTKRRLKFRQNNSHEPTDSHPTVNQYDSPQFCTIEEPRKGTEIQYNLLPPSSHILRMSLTQPLRVTRPYSPVLRT